MLSGIVTAILLLLFLIGSLWAFSPRRKKEFEAAAQLPFGDDAPDDATTNRTNEEETGR
jgi:cytochrome c oxidase cbb3-type subunit IV